MERWKQAVALMVAGVFAVGPAWAQGTTDKSKSTTDKSATSGAMEKDKGTAGTTDKSPTGKMEKGTADKGEMKAGKADRGMMKAGGNREQMKAVQQALKDKGHDPGPVDGVMGKRTMAALKDFQKAQGLKETGRLDSETMAKLGVDMKTGAARSSEPAASPKTDAAKPDSAAQPSASPSTGQDPAKPSGDAPKPAEEKKQ